MGLKFVEPYKTNKADKNEILRLGWIERADQSKIKEGNG